MKRESHELVGAPFSAQTPNENGSRERLDEAIHAEPE
jgi:hypothetical protein